jgi:hypothetical protein
MAKEREWITPIEEKILTTAVQLKVVKSSDIADVLPSLSAAQRTYQIKKLVDQGMLLPVNPGARHYTIGFSNNYLIRGVIKSLREEGFIPEQLDRPYA